MLKAGRDVQPILPPTYLLTSLGVAGALWLVAPGPQIVAPPWNLIGVPLVVLGIALNILADNRFKQAQTAVNPSEKPSALVTSGPYRWSRHPMYLGLLLISLGTGIALGHLTPLIASALLFVVLNFRFVPREELTMATHFGEDYARYRSQVRRWL
jgi:protein-S-isoprenylcysteine O-methyltransferase Ste14